MANKLLKISNDLSKLAKNKNNVNTDKARIKFKSELVRVLFYMLVGYDTKDHPWGSNNKPSYPEFMPLNVKSTNGEELRTKIEGFLSDPGVDLIVRKLLRDLSKEVK